MLSSKNRICFHSWGQNKWMSLNDSIFSKNVGSRVVIKLSAAEITFYFIYLSVFFTGWELAQGIVIAWAQQRGEVLIAVLQERDKSWRSSTLLLSSWSLLPACDLLGDMVFFLLTVLQDQPSVCPSISEVHRCGNRSKSHGTSSLPQPFQITSQFLGTSLNTPWDMPGER